MKQLFLIMPDKGDHILVIVYHILVLIDVLIGLFAKSNSMGLKHKEKVQIPNTHFRCCSVPIFGFLLLLIQYDENEGIISSVLKCVVLILSLVDWVAWLYKNHMIKYAALLILVPAIVFPATLHFRQSFVIYLLALCAHIYLDYSYYENISYYVAEAKQKFRQVRKNYHVLVLQTLIQIIALLCTLIWLDIFALALVAIGLVECIIIWLIDCCVVIKEPEETKAEEIQPEKTSLMEEETVNPPDNAQPHVEPSPPIEKIEEVKKEEVKSEIIEAPIVPPVEEDELIAEKTGKPSRPQKEPEAEPEPKKEEEKPVKKIDKEAAPPVVEKPIKEIETKPIPVPEDKPAPIVPKEEEIKIIPPVEVKKEAPIKEETEISQVLSALPTLPLLVISEEEKKKAIIDEVITAEPDSSSPKKTGDVVIKRLVKSDQSQAAKMYVMQTEDKSKMVWKNCHFILALDCSGN